MKNYGIILASGNGSRYKNSLPKQFVKIAGKTVLEHTIEIFENSDKISSIVIVVTPEYRELAESILLKNNYKKVEKLLNGGATRKESSHIGILSIEEDEANVVIHDCARPFLTQQIINNCVEALDHYDAVDVAIPSADTIIEVEDNVIKNIPDRSRLMRGQTPQCFKLSVIKKAHDISKNDSNFTDDCGLILKYGLGTVYVVEGDIKNIKITYPSDIYLAEEKSRIMDEIYSKYQVEKNNKILLYAPTFRDNDRLDAYDIDMSSCVKALEDKYKSKYSVFVRLHPNVQERAKDFLKFDEYTDVSKHPDVMELLISSDVIITDYSCLMFEFMHTRKPVFLYGSDIDEYMKERGFYLDIKNLMFPFARTNDQLIRNIINFDKDSYLQKVEAFIKESGSSDNGKASKYIVDRIKGVIEHD